MSAELAKPQTRTNPKTFVTTVALLVVAALSITLLRGIFSSPDTYRGAYAKLNEKRDNVMVLTSAAVAASASLSLMPGDAGTSLSDQLMVMAKDFSFILAAIVLEKYLLTMMGAAFFGIVVPLCCGIFALTGFMPSADPKRLSWRQATLKLFALGLILFLATPLSVYMASSIDETYQVSTEVGSLEEQGNQIANDVSATEEADTAGAASQEGDADNPIDFLGKQVNNVTTTVGGAVEGAVEGATKALTGAIVGARAMIGNLIELFGVMLVTSVFIPLLAPVIMYLGFKALFDQQLQISPAPQQIQVVSEKLPPAAAAMLVDAGAPAAIQQDGQENPSESESSDEASGE